MKKKVTKFLSALVVIIFATLSIMTVMPVEAKADEAKIFQYTQDGWKEWSGSGYELLSVFHGVLPSELTSVGVGRVGVDGPTVHLPDGSKEVLGAPISTKYYDLSQYSSPINWTSSGSDIYFWYIPTVTLDAYENWDPESGSTVVTLSPMVTWIKLSNNYDSGIEVYANGGRVSSFGDVGGTLNISTPDIAGMFSLEPGVTIRLNWETYDNVINFTYTVINDSNPPSGNSGNSNGHVHNYSWQTITEPTKDRDGLEGEMCSCGAVRNTQPLSAYAYALNEYATPMINAAKPGQTITFEFGEMNSFPKSFMQKLVEKNGQNVTFVFHYKWNHVKQEIKIPAGTPVDLNFDWYGPAKMAELYGMN